MAQCATKLGFASSAVPGHEHSCHWGHFPGADALARASDTAEVFASQGQAFDPTTNRAVNIYGFRRCAKHAMLVLSACVCNRPSVRGWFLDDSEPRLIMARLEKAAQAERAETALRAQVGELVLQRNECEQAGRAVMSHASGVTEKTSARYDCA